MGVRKMPEQMEARGGKLLRELRKYSGINLGALPFWIALLIWKNGFGHG